MSSRKSRLRLYADENIPIPSITHLKKKGISIIHAFDFKFVEKPDKDHLQKRKSKISNSERTTTISCLVKLKMVYSCDE